MPSIQIYAAAFSTTVIPPVSSRLAATLRLSAAMSPSPNFSENTVPLPIDKPSITDVIKTIRVYAEPTAASASAPIKRPTMSVSAML